MNKGLFITLEGCDGAGKSLLLKNLGDYFLEHFPKKVVTTFEPGDNSMGEILVNQLQKDLSVISESLIFSLDRALHVKEVIIPALESGNMVICDRYVDSFIAYQGYGRGQDISLLQSLSDFSTEGLMPELTLYLDLDPDLSLSRKVVRDRFESEYISFHNRVRKGYLELSKQFPKRIRVLDSSINPKDLFRIAREYCELIV